MEATYGLTGGVHYGRGWPHLLRLANPAAGIAAVHQVPGDRVQRLVVARAKLTASEAAATREVALQLLDADGVPFGVFSPVGEVKASGAASFTWAVGSSRTTAILGGESQSAIPDLLLSPGMSVKVAVSAIDAADQLSAVSFYLEEWPNGPDGYPTGIEQAALPPWLLK
jgi:Flp pilus assembly protein CpaB